MVESVLLVPLFLAVIGLIFGSFGSVLITRIPLHVGLGGRSHCPKCDRKLSAVELIPVISYVFQRGMCKGCREKISMIYPLIEFLSAVAFVSAWFYEPNDIVLTAAYAFAFWSMLLIVAVDLRTQHIPDLFTAILALSGVVISVRTGDWSVTAPLVGGGFFAVQWVLSWGRWVGSGDILLGAAIGLFLGSLPLTVEALGIAYISGGAIVSVLLLLGLRKRDDAVAFGPFLILGTIVALLWGTRILEYLWQ